jgi:mono/diheme cytochrome c family protein
MSWRFRPTLLAAAGLAFTLVALPSAAQQTVKHEPITPIADVSGAATFGAYCTVCHGPAGKGDGPAAKVLTTPPADLTQISKRHGGKYPAASVRMSIIGDTALPAHGTRDMPMWGPVFSHTEGDATSMLRLRNLVGYLESFQEK